MQLGADAFVPNPANHGIWSFLTTVVVNLTILTLTWFKLSKKLDHKTDEIKKHSDVVVQKLNGTLTAFLHSMDRPCWIKVAREENGEVVFRMLEVNHHYTNLFGIDRQNYLGKTDLEAGWDHATAEEFRQHDLMVWASGEPQTFEKTINDSLMRFHKSRLETPDGRTKGVIGYMVDCNDPAHCPVYANTQGG